MRGALDRFFLRLLAVFLQMTLLVTSIAPTGLLLVGSHRAGQPHLENRIIWSRFL